MASPLGSSSSASSQPSREDVLASRALAMAPAVVRKHIMEQVSQHNADGHQQSDDAAGQGQQQGMMGAGNHAVAGLADNLRRAHQHMAHHAHNSQSHHHHHHHEHDDDHHHHHHNSHAAFADDISNSILARDENDGCVTLYASTLRGYADVAIPACFVLAAFGPLAAFFPLLPWLVSLAFGLFVSVHCVGLSRAAKQARAGLLISQVDIAPTRFMVTLIVSLTNYSALHFFVLAGVARRVDDHWPLVLLLGALFAASNPLLYRCTTADPGFVERVGEGSPPFPNPPPGSIEKGYVWCPTCGVARPPRAKHDSISGKCVRRFDHYCPIVNNAVGEGNQRSFLAYVAVMFTGQAIYLHLMALYLSREGDVHASTVTYGGWAALANAVSRIAPGLANYTRGCALCPVGRALHWAQIPGIVFAVFLLTRHSFQAAVNLTTNESLNIRRYRSFWARVAHRAASPATWAHELYRNPYDLGVYGNCMSYWTASGTAERFDGRPCVNYDERATMSSSAVDGDDDRLDTEAARGGGGIAALSLNRLSVLYYQVALRLKFLPLTHVVMQDDEESAHPIVSAEGAGFAHLGLPPGKMDASMRARMELAQRFLKGELSAQDASHVVSLNDLPSSRNL